VAIILGRIKKQINKMIIIQKRYDGPMRIYADTDPEYTKEIELVKSLIVEPFDLYIEVKENTDIEPATFKVFNVGESKITQIRKSISQMGFSGVNKDIIKGDTKPIKEIVNKIEAKDAKEANDFLFNEKVDAEYKANEKIHKQNRKDVFVERYKNNIDGDVYMFVEDGLDIIQMPEAHKAKGGIYTENELKYIVGTYMALNGVKMDKENMNHIIGLYKHKTIDIYKIQKIKNELRIEDKYKEFVNKKKRTYIFCVENAELDTEYTLALKIGNTGKYKKDKYNEKRNKMKKMNEKDKTLIKQKLVFNYINKTMRDTGIMPNKSLISRELNISRNTATKYYNKFKNEYTK
jgi:hypothetical protein